MDLEATLRRDADLPFWTSPFLERHPIRPLQQPTLISPTGFDTQGAKDHG
jgi:hypothetical protein